MRISQGGGKVVFRKSLLDVGKQINLKLSENTLPISSGEMHQKWQNARILSVEFDHLRDLLYSN